MRFKSPILLLFAILFFVGCQASDSSTDLDSDWLLVPPATDATPVSAPAQLAAIYPVGSRIKDRQASGFGPCSNYPKDLTGKAWGMPGQLTLVAFPEEPVAYFKHCGLPLRVVNRTEETISFRACDSKLSIACEAQDAHGQWREIESEPQVICGNSFHVVALGAEQFWEFPARQYTGPLKTKLRYRLKDVHNLGLIYSNEFEGQIEPAQFLPDERTK